MSSRNRRKQIEQEESLLNDNPNALNARRADAIGFGGLDGLGNLALDIASADAKFQTIENVDIFEIVPNLIQPRYAIPHLLTDIFQVRSENITDIFGRWITEVELERGITNLDITEHLRSGSTARGDEAEKQDDDIDHIAAKKSPNIETSLMKIVDLASSIRRDGLSNPISVVRRDGFYELETGERRWLAYHMLYWKFGDGDIIDNGQTRDWSKIPSRIVREVDVWRQASENNARDNLNAISKARQLALLLMDLHGWDKFTPFNEFDSEQDFYAQVSDGRDWRIPKGQGERLLNAMGLSHASQLRQYRSLLRLSPDDWRRGDDENLTEGELRKIQSRANTVTPVTVSSPEKEKPKTDAVTKLAVDAHGWRSKVRKQLSSADENTRMELRNLVEDEIEQLKMLMDELDNMDG